MLKTEKEGMSYQQLKGKETSCYKPSDLWSQEDDFMLGDHIVEGKGKIIMSSIRSKRNT